MPNHHLKLIVARRQNALQDPRTTPRTIVSELRDRVSNQRRVIQQQDAEIERLRMLLAEQRLLLAEAQPCPACIAKGASQ